LQDRLGPFRAELEGKSKHLTPSNFGTNKQKCDAAIPLDASKEESPAVHGSDNMSQTFASVYAILRTEVIQEVGQLRSFVESEVQRLCSYFEVQSAKVEQNIVIVSRSEATNKCLSQRMAEIDQDVARLRARDLTSGSELSELRSRLEVVVRECDEHISREQGHRAEESAAFLSSLKQENELSDRVQSLEKACQRSIAMPSVVLEAAESLRAELRQVVDPLREDVDSLKQANASSQRHDKEFRDLAESKDTERGSSHHEVASLHRRLSDLEAACAAQSQKSGKLQQNLGAVQQVLSQELSRTWSTVNGQVALVTQTVELLRKEFMAVQEQTNSLTDSLADACASSILKAEASLSRELNARKNGNLPTGNGVVIASPKLSPRPPVEGQPKEVSQVSKLEGAITGLHQMVAGTLMSRISDLESMMGSHLGSSKNPVAQSQAHSQVPISVQAESTSASKSHPAIVPKIDMKAARVTRLASATGRATQPSLQASKPAAGDSVSLVSPSPMVCAARETREETGMTLQPSMQPMMPAAGVSLSSVPQSPVVRAARDISLSSVPHSPMVRGTRGVREETGLMLRRPPCATVLNVADGPDYHRKSAASADVVEVLRRDGRGMNASNTMRGSLGLSSRQHGQRWHASRATIHVRARSTEAPA